MNSKSREPLIVRVGPAEAVNDFIYLPKCKRMEIQSEPDVKQRVSKASQVNSILKNVWKSKKFSRSTKIRIF